MLSRRKHRLHIIPSVLFAAYIARSFILQIDWVHTSFTSEQSFPSYIEADSGLSSYVINNATTITTESGHNGSIHFGLDTELSPSDSDNITTLITAVESGRYSYVYLIGGCNPAKPVYRGYIYNILIAARILRENGSTADINVFFQLSWESKATILPLEDTRLLDTMDIGVIYIPKQEHESFYAVNMQKFRVLGMTEYSRVLFMDGDIIPLGNLDYFFALSEQGVLKENVGMMGVNEPTNGGFWMVKPQNIERCNEIIQEREHKARESEYPFFDPVEGWGHTIIPSDHICMQSSCKRQDTNWTFLAAFADQGLLYHWMKYEQKSFSHIHPNGTIQNWGIGLNGSVESQEFIDSPFKNLSNPILPVNRMKRPPFADFWRSQENKSRKRIHFLVTYRQQRRISILNTSGIQLFKRSNTS
mmetsp:Transcript_20536/g.24457  ORF Transcript_20536/g.24457 Transcript_20536/m.24457 type:complete len:417 (+) Transcript_20536:88-1338(+)